MYYYYHKNALISQCLMCFLTGFQLIFILLSFKKLQSNWNTDNVYKENKLPTSLGISLQSSLPLLTTDWWTPWECCFAFRGSRQSTASPALEWNIPYPHACCAAFEFRGSLWADLRIVRRGGNKFYYFILAVSKLTLTIKLPSKVRQIENSYTNIDKIGRPSKRGYNI